MEQRRTPRFKLQLPLSITRSGAERVSLKGLTKNISSTGVLFTSLRGAEPGGPIEYVISLNPDDGPAVSLRCIGKVVRAEPAAKTDASAFEVAATLERYEFARER